MKVTPLEIIEFVLLVMLAIVFKYQTYEIEECKRVVNILAAEIKEASDKLERLSK